MTPVFFGSSERQLFGVFHPPRRGEGMGRGARGGTDFGVVLCHPGPQEYNRAHWSFRNLATLLAGRGIPVLRFDYSGTGDSAGGAGDATPERWQDDLRGACDELRDAFGVGALSVIGMRLGGAVAARACAAGLGLRDLFLWEPVVRGRTYLEDLDDLDRSVAFHLLHRPSRRGKDELCGFPMPPAQRALVAEIDLTTLAALHARRTEIFVSEAHTETTELARALARAGSAVACHIVAEVRSARSTASHGKAALATNVLTALVARMTEAP